LFAGLIAPSDRAAWVGIVRILARIVIPTNGLQQCARLEHSRLRQAVAQLPVKCVVDAEQRFDRASVVNQVVLKPRSAQMQVREEAQQRGVVWQSAMRL